MKCITIVFHPIGPLWLIIVGLVSVGLIFIWKEWQRPIKFKAIRVLAQAIAILAILGLALHPSNETTRSPNSYLLLTKNYSNAIVDSLIKIDNTLKILKTKEADNFPTAKTLENWNTFPSYNIKFVLGEGVSFDILDILPIRDYRFFPAEIPFGITSLSLNPFFANRRNVLHGTFTSHHKKLMLRLEGPSGLEDSVRIIDPISQNFSLSFIPKASGKFLYHLSFAEENKTARTEILPLEILPEKKLSILILQQYPTAEIRYLKNFLSTHHHSLILRYRISQNNYSYEYANRGYLKADHLTTELLNSFDLVVADDQILDQLPSAEQANLRQSLNLGLGLIITHNTNAARSTSYSQLTFDNAPPDTVTVKLALGNKFTLPALSLKTTDPAFEKLLTTKSNRPLSGFIPQGIGKIGYQLLQETFTLQLKGNASAYSDIWSPLIEIVARQKRNNFKIEINELPRQADDPLFVKIISTGNMPQLYSDSIQIPLKEDLIMDDVWHGKLWVSEAGWHSLLIPSDSTVFNYYVHDKNEWNSLTLSHQIRLNSSSGHRTLKEISLSEKQMVEFPTIIFFVIFLLASGFLWLAPKL